MKFVNTWTNWKEANMNKLISLMPTHWAEALGWTLLHSLWQGLFVVLVTIIILRLVPQRLSSVRYGVSVGALAAIIIASVVTFILALPAHHEESQTAALAQPFYFVYADNHSPVASTWLVQAESFINHYASAISLAWSVGALLFSLRLLAGWFFITRLRQQAIPLGSPWTSVMDQLAAQLSLSRTVQLAESATLHAPVAIGYLKPMILVPTGMLTGLTPEEAETILLHELAHIRRHDYLVNIIQSVFESLLFFNPFVWMISAIIRREREHCCDDAVVAYHGNPLAYAYALTRLEEVRLTHSSLALSLAENKNQLLNRIKRIMEKSAKQYSNRDKIVPVVLLMTGLACASFLTLHTTEPAAMAVVSFDPVTDTLKPKKKEKSATYIRKSVTTIDNNNEPVEVISEDFSGDEAPAPFMAIGADNFVMPAIPGIADFDMIPPMPFMGIAYDTFPNGLHRMHAAGDWEEFSQEFEKKFKERFGDFYKTHAKEFEAMMQDMHKQFNDDEWEHHTREAMRRSEEAMMRSKEATHRSEEALKRSHEALGKLQQEDYLRMQEDALRKSEEALARMGDLSEQEVAMKRLEKEMQELDERMAKMGSEMEAMGKNMKMFEEEVNTELINDGYLKKGEKIRNMSWEDDGQLEVNGVKIKEKDKAKYDKIHRKYFKKGGNFHYSE